MRRLILLGWIFAAGLLSGQEPIRVNVRLVNVAFSVRDEHGALVNNLGKDEVEVFEDAVPQISFFARSLDVPLTLGLIVDFSGSQEHFSKQHQHDLEVFLKEVLGPRDRVFLVCFGNHIRLASDFTQSGEELMERLKQYQKDNRHIPELGPREDRELGTAFYDSIYYSVTEKLAREGGRRALLFSAMGKTIPAPTT
jgi:Ca-activated chloride channel homolog